MIQIKNKVDCCGCTACANICPKQAITMKPDPEGFLYPVVNEENCINCGVCDATCPIHNKIDRTKEKTKGFILRVKDEKILFESTSGGGFTALAEYVLKNGGVVYGAGYDDSMRVICKKATSNDELKEMRGSKFVQSLLGNTYKDVKDVVEQALPHEYEVLSREQAMRLFLQERLIGISMCTKLVKRSAIENIKFEVGRASNEDKDFLFNTLLSATRIVALQTKYYCYWTRENSATTRPFDKRWFDGYYFAKKIYVCICEKMPKLEADARYQLLSSCYFLVRQMDNQKVRKDYPSEYRMIKNEIHDLRIDDILNIISPQRRKGIMLIKYAPWLYSLLKG